MKYFLLTILLIAFAHSASAENGLEGLSLCSQDELVKNVVLQMRDEDGFKKSGRYFYIPNTEKKAFGYKVNYAGYVGVDEIPGPNLTVEGSFDEVVKTVKSESQKDFECQPEGCASEIDQDFVILIYPHPNIENNTIIQCAFRNVR